MCDEHRHGGCQRCSMVEHVGLHMVIAPPHQPGELQDGQQGVLLRQRLQFQTALAIRGGNEQGRQWQLVVGAALRNEYVSLVRTDAVLCCAGGEVCRELTGSGPQPQSGGAQPHARYRRGSDGQYVVGDHPGAFGTHQCSEGALAHPGVAHESEGCGAYLYGASVQNSLATQVEQECQQRPGGHDGAHSRVRPLDQVQPDVLQIGGDDHVAHRVDAHEVAGVSGAYRGVPAVRVGTEVQQYFPGGGLLGVWHVRTVHDGDVGRYLGTYRAVLMEFEGAGDGEPVQQLTVGQGVDGAHDKSSIGAREL